MTKSPKVCHLWPGVCSRMRRGALSSDLHVRGHVDAERPVDGPKCVTCGTAFEKTQEGEYFPVCFCHLDGTAQEQWAIVEIMGHQTFAGKISEHTFAGTTFVRIDVPAIDGRPAFTKLYGGGAIYAITPVEKDAALAAASRLKQSPVTQWELPDHYKQARLGFDEEYDE